MTSSYDDLWLYTTLYIFVSSFLPQTTPKTNSTLENKDLEQDFLRVHFQEPEQLPVSELLPAKAMSCGLNCFHCDVQVLLEP
jgi:hypothetical protein